ncbi:hypothetical protein [Kaistia defluvii]|uniref:Membrane protein DedA with SNARE-associated domain n=1 Tax=Kaistia defluvii TaxID=410841 RepID=A0ABV2R145_9HYPH
MAIVATLLRFTALTSLSLAIWASLDVIKHYAGQPASWSVALVLLIIALASLCRDLRQYRSTRLSQRG